MKILSILLRVYFFLAGSAAVLNAIFLLTKEIDWSLTVGLSMFVTLFIGFAYLFFAWKFDELLPQRKHFMQGAILITLCNTLATAFLGAMGQNQVKVFRELDINQLIIYSVIAIVIYSLLIYLVGKVSSKKVISA